MSRSGKTHAAARLAALALFACAALAIFNLPRQDLPAGWLLAWTAPAALFGCMRHHTNRPWLRACAAALAQIVAFLVAMRYLGALSQPAILACTILPPLAFVTVRRRDADAALGLFLSFCVLLVGIILGGTHLELLVAYGVCACISLRSESHLTVLAISSSKRSRTNPAMAMRPVLLTGFAVAIPCLFIAFATDRILAAIPSPLGHTPTSGAPKTARSEISQPGLDNAFDLDSGDLLTNLAGQRLLQASTRDGSPMPTDLYLRSGFFATAHLDRWELGQLRLMRASPNSPAEDRQLQEGMRGVPEQWLEIKRFAGARNFVFVPPTATTLRAVPGLQWDPIRMWLRQDRQAERSDYQVTYQDLLEPGPRDKIDPAAEQLDLLQLPIEFRGVTHRRYLNLLEQWDATGPPWHIAQRIATGLAGHCLYERTKPIGPYKHALDNFLFSEIDRRGYCMHFASAAALMLRLRGVPCRIGVGLYGGNRVDDQTRVYGSQHAHAWVEIPLEGRGYVVFDPTPPDERGQRMTRQLDDAQDDTSEDVAADTASGQFWSGLVAFVMQPWFLALILLVAIAATMWPGNSARPSQHITLPRSIRTARRVLVRILRSLAESGHLRERGQTLEQFSAVLANRGRLAADVATAFRTYQEVRFGGLEYDASREGKLLSGLEAAMATTPWLPNEDDQSSI